MYLPHPTPNGKYFDMAINGTSKNTTARDISRAVSKASLKTSTPSTKSKGKAKGGKSKKLITSTKQVEEMIQQLRLSHSKFDRDKIDVKEIFSRVGQQAQMDFPRMVDGSDAGTPLGVVQSVLLPNNADDIQKIVDDMSSFSIGRISDDVDPNGLGTMQMARGIATGEVDTNGSLAEGILGDSSDKMARKLAERGESTPSTQIGVSATINVSAVVSAPKVCTAVTTKVAAATQQCVGAMAAGVAVAKQLNSIVGGMNGARALLQASLQKALDMKVAQMMSKIVAAIKSAHGITHPLFESIFMMTWAQNLDWKPDFGGTCAKWLQCVKEIPEYFDFIQKVMGGAIADIMKGCDDMFTTIVQTVGNLANSTLNGQLNLNILVPPLNVPLMSISKQIEEVLNKIMLIKAIIMMKARLILQRLKSLQAPELYLNLPSDFFLILEVLIEAEFIYANLPIVLDKILEFFLNLFVQEFAKIAEAIIGKIFGIWKKVIEIVPPLQDLLQLCWAIPNQADLCVNLALNIALPEMWAIVQPFIDMPFQCINMISTACDQATLLAYQIPVP
jgi:hypothetical protein